MAVQPQLELTAPIFRRTLAAWRNNQVPNQSASASTARLTLWPMSITPSPPPKSKSRKEVPHKHQDSTRAAERAGEAGASPARGGETGLAGNRRAAGGVIRKGAADSSRRRNKIERFRGERAGCIVAAAHACPSGRGGFGDWQQGSCARGNGIRPVVVSLERTGHFLGWGHVASVESKNLGGVI